MNSTVIARTSWYSNCPRIQPAEDGSDNQETIGFLLDRVKRDPDDMLRHVAVARVLKSASTLDLHGPSTTEIAIPLLPEWGANGLRVVAFIQDPISGYVLGVVAQQVKS